ncbi:hypothetical protein DRB96_17050 [Streptomyces sp. ICC1]|nr:hypothetical protein DRB96_17050 [Streptomyces sp. ICC1]
MACVGSATGLPVSWMLGAPAAGVAQGPMGYNAVLVAMALCGVFVAPSALSFVSPVAGPGALTGVRPRSGGGEAVREAAPLPADCGDA